MGLFHATGKTKESYMETRASYILVGVFTLAMVAAAFGYVLWAAKKSNEQEQDYYVIHFEGSERPFHHRSGSAQRRARGAGHRH